MYANSVPVYNADFSDIKRCLLIVIEQAPQFINRLVLRECRFARRTN
jgi:hypothetical protein